jgi:two-component system sensor histidine kinase KdpD
MAMKLPTFTQTRMLSLTLPWLMPLVATALSLLLAGRLSGENLPLIYLIGVLITAVSTRLRPALACAVLSFFAYNLFLTEPTYSLKMLHQSDILTGIILMLAALITGHLAGRLKEQVDALRASESWNSQQMACARELAAVSSEAAIVDAVIAHLQQTLGCHVRHCDDTASAPASIDSAGSATWSTDTAGATIHFLDAGGARSASLRLSATEPLTDWHHDRLDAIMNLARLAWTRVQLAQSLRLETLDKEREQLRATLLSSISHDLRTPLSTMIGSVSSLIDLSDSLSSTQRNELLANTLTEARRLDRYIQKLLDMTRLGRGELTLDRDWIGLDDIISVVMRRAEHLMDQQQLELELPEDLPLLHVHPALIEQALFNVLENAIRFSPRGEKIRITARRDADLVHLDVHDNGPGIAAADREKVFDMFHTFSHGDQFDAGTGLGLAICRSIMGAHGGEAAILDSPAGSGTTVRMSLPVSEAGIVEDADE